MDLNANEKVHKNMSNTFDVTLGTVACNIIACLRTRRSETHTCPVFSSNRIDKSVMLFKFHTPQLIAYGNT